jgi:hypothetical protein
MWPHRAQVCAGRQPPAEPARSAVPVLESGPGCRSPASCPAAAAAARDSVGPPLNPSRALRCARVLRIPPLTSIPTAPDSQLSGEGRGKVTPTALLGELCPVADSRVGSAFARLDIAAARVDRDWAGEDGSSVGCRCQRLIGLVGSGVCGFLLNAWQWCDAVDVRRSAARREQEKCRGGKSGTNSQPKL